MGQVSEWDLALGTDHERIMTLSCPAHLLGDSHASQGIPRLVLHWLVHLGLFLLVLLALVHIHGSGTGLISFWAVLWRGHWG